jgi:tRNA pseudouridine32 synthase/23S rRNA pseudouridine746 synthase
VPPLFHPFDPPPLPSAPPQAFPSPFDERDPQPLARRAAESLQARLRAEPIGGASDGKMFGVLVVRSPDGRLGWLQAFSGMMDGRWELPGFVPPLFDADARAAVEVPGEAVVKGLIARHAALRDGPALRAPRAELALLGSRHEAERLALRERHEQNRAHRKARRGEVNSVEALHALDQESRRDKAERRRLEAAHEAEARAAAPALGRLERRVAAADRLRQIVSRQLMKRIHDTYRVPNSAGHARPLRSLFAPGEPPSGAADCAGPKLLAAAYSLGMKPIALAEFWWGATPATGGRLEGAYYPACREKCGPVLPFMLEGLEVAPARRFLPPVAPSGALRIVHEDRWIIVVDKPAGLLSVPAKDPSITDSVLARLQALHPGAQLAHRLDLDTSGLLVAARDAATQVALQRQFAAREVRKRYVAWVSGVVAGERGRVELAMRVDLDDRPRQIHDPVHGKPAVTEWEVVERRGGRTRLHLFPLTGRTHQLRVHAAHPLGLGAPIVGDRLYGHPAGRLMLHAEQLEFVHPATAAAVAFASPAPF